MFTYEINCKLLLERIYFLFRYAVKNEVLITLKLNANCIF